MKNLTELSDLELCEEIERRQGLVSSKVLSDLTMALVRQELVSSEELSDLTMVLVSRMRRLHSRLAEAMLFYEEGVADPLGIFKTE